MKKLAFIFLIGLLLLSGCGKKENATASEGDMPKNIVSYDEKENAELIPNGQTVEHGEVVEAKGIEADLPNEDELGEYEQVLMTDDIIDENTYAGWVMAVSLKDITVNTNNKLTTYSIESGAANTAKHLKVGDAVIVRFSVNEDGSKSAYDLGRVRTEDAPLTKDEIQGMYGVGADGGE